MITFEVHRLVGERWVLDAVYDDQATATAEAKNLLASARKPMAVRVLACKEETSGPEEVYFIECAVHREKIAEQIEVNYAVERPASAEKPAAIKPRPRDPRPPEPAREPPPRRPTLTVTLPVMPRPVPVVRPRVGILVLVLMLGAFLGILAHRASLSRSGWIFDSPEAQQPHAVRNPLTGEYFGRGLHP